MTDTKWTAGPWKACGTIYEHMNAEVRSGAKGEGQAIAQVWDGPNAFPNACLMAAAPDLYAALEALESVAKYGGFRSKPSLQMLAQLWPEPTPPEKKVRTMDRVHSGASASIPTEGEDRLRRLRFAEAFVAFAHGDQKYGDQPYSYHLSAVAEILKDWGCDDDTLIAGLLHDVLEDTTVNSDTILNLFGPRVYWMVQSVSGYGQTRAEKLEHIYGEIRFVCPPAAVVKLADRIANVEAALPGDKHIQRYAAEQPGFEAVIRPLVAETQWARLVDALGASAGEALGGYAEGVNPNQTGEA